jgi:hypothetical protein
LDHNEDEDEENELKRYEKRFWRFDDATNG